MDLNPLIGTPSSITVVDARIRIEKKPATVHTVTETKKKQS